MTTQNKPAEDNLLERVANATDLFSGLQGDAISTDSFYRYIENTKKVVEQNPQLFVGIQNPENMVEMFNYALSNWNTASRIDSLLYLSEKEIDLIKKGYIIDDDGDGEGFFTAILDMHIEAGLREGILNGTCKSWQLKCIAENKLRQARELAEKLRKAAIEKANQAHEWANKQRREASEKARKLAEEAKRRVEETARKLAEARRKAAERLKDNYAKVKDRIKDINPKDVIGKVNKYNPVTIAMRNSLRLVLSVNLFGLATILSKRDETASRVSDKVLNMYKLMGGKEEKYYEAIKNGAKKKPVLNKKYRDQFNKKGGGLGEPVTIASSIALISAPLIAIWKWIKGAGLDELIPELVDKMPNGKEDDQPDENNNYLPDENNDNYLPDNTKIGQDTGLDVDIDTTEKKNKYLKPALIGGGLLLIAGGIGYYFYSKNSLGSFQLT